MEMEERDVVYPDEPRTLTPADVRAQRFPKRMTGYDPEAVHTFLDTVADYIETLLRENEDLKNHLAMMEAEVEEFRNIEKLMREAVKAAQEKANEHVQRAQQEARQLVEKAQKDAEKIVRDAQKRAQELREELAHLEEQRQAFLEDLRILASQIQEMVRAYRKGVRGRSS